MSHFKAKMHQIQFRLRLSPRPHWGSLQRSPRPLAGFKGPTSKGREGRGQEGRGGEGRGGKGGEERSTCLPPRSERREREGRGGGERGRDGKGRGGEREGGKGREEKWT